MQTNELPPSYKGGDSQATKEYRKTYWVKPLPGNDNIILRLLTSSYVSKRTHFVRTKTGMATIECLGVDCPICESNRFIRDAHPEDFRDQKGYWPYTVRCGVNVLDKSMVVICPECGTEYYSSNGVFPTTCSKDGKSLVGITPVVSNKVKILSRGRTFFDQLSDINKSVSNSSGMDITQFDIQLMGRPSATGVGAEVSIIPMPHMAEPLEEGHELYDVGREIAVKLTADEIREFLNNVSLKDIFSARRAARERQSDQEQTVTRTGPAPSEEAEEVRDEVVEKATEKAKGILGKFLPGG